MPGALASDRRGETVRLPSAFGGIDLVLNVISVDEDEEEETTGGEEFEEEFYLRIGVIVGGRAEPVKALDHFGVDFDVDQAREVRDKIDAKIREIEELERQR